MVWKDYVENDLTKDERGGSPIDVKRGPGSDVEVVQDQKPPKIWIQISSDLEKDGWFFGAIGAICATIQYIGYRYFDGANVGAELLQEHIAFNTLALLAIFLLVVRSVLLWKPWMASDRLLAFVRHVAQRTVAFGSVAASVTIGFAFVVALCGSYWHAWKFVQAALYFASLAEVAANPLVEAEMSRAFVPAWAFLIITPFLY